MTTFTRVGVMSLRLHRPKALPADPKSEFFVGDAKYGCDDLGTKCEKSN